MSQILKNKPNVSRSSHDDEVEKAKRIMALEAVENTADPLPKQKEALEKLSQQPSHELSADLSRIAQASFHKFTGLTSNALSSDRLKENQEHTKVFGLDVNAGMSMTGNILKNAMGPRWVASFADRMANLDDLSTLNAPAPFKAILNKAQETSSFLRDKLDTKTSEQFSKVGAEITGDYSQDLSKQDIQERIANYLSDKLGTISGKTLGMRGLVSGEQGKFLNMLTQFGGFHSSDKVLDLIHKNVDLSKNGKTVNASLKNETTKEFDRLCKTLAEQFHSILTLRKTADIIGGTQGENLVKNLANSISASGIHARDARGSGVGAIGGMIAGMATGGAAAIVRTPAFTLEGVASAKNNTGLVIEDLRNELQPAIEAKLNEDENFTNLTEDQKKLAVFEAMYPRLIEALNARAAVDAGVQAGRNTTKGFIASSLLKAGGLKNNPLNIQEGVTDMNALLEANQALVQQREELIQNVGSENMVQIKAILDALEYNPNISSLNKSTNERLGKAKLSDLKILGANIFSQVMSSESMAVGGTVLSVATAGAFATAPMIAGKPYISNDNLGFEGATKNVSGLYQNGLGSVYDRNFNVIKTGEAISQSIANAQMAGNAAMRLGDQNAQITTIQEFVSGKPTSVVNEATYNGKKITILSAHENHSQPPAGYKTILHNGFKFQVLVSEVASFNPSLVDISTIESPLVDAKLNPGMSLKKAGVGNTYALELPSLKSNLGTSDTANDFTGTINLGNGKTIKIEGGVSNQFITLEVDGKLEKFVINGTNATDTGKGYVELIKVSEAFANPGGFIDSKIASTVGYSAETSTATFAQNENQSTVTASSTINLGSSTQTQADTIRFAPPDLTIDSPPTNDQPLSQQGLDTPSSLRVPASEPASEPVVSTQNSPSPSVQKQSATPPSSIFTPKVDKTQESSAVVTPTKPTEVPTSTSRPVDSSNPSISFGTKAPEGLNIGDKPKSNIFTPVGDSTIPVKLNANNETAQAPAKQPIFATPSTPSKAENSPSSSVASGEFSLVGKDGFMSTLVKSGLAKGNGTGAVIAEKPISIQLQNGKIVNFNPGDRINAQKVLQALNKGGVKASELAGIKTQMVINGVATAPSVVASQPTSPFSASTQPIKPSSLASSIFTPPNIPQNASSAETSSVDLVIKGQQEVLSNTRVALNELNKIPKSNLTLEQRSQIKALEARQLEAKKGLKQNIDQRNKLGTQQTPPNATGLVFGTPNSNLSFTGSLGNLNFNNNSGRFASLFNTNPSLRDNLTPFNQAQYRGQILESLKKGPSNGIPDDYAYTTQEQAKIKDLDARIKAINDNTNLTKIGKAKLVEELKNQKLEVFADAMTRDAVANQFKFNATIRLPQSAISQLNSSTLVPTSPLTQLNTGLTTELPKGTIPLEINNTLAGAKFAEIFKPIPVDPKTLIDLPGDKNNSTLKVGDKIYQLKYAQTAQGLVGVVVGEDGKFNTINSTDPRVQAYLNQNTVVNGKSISIRQILSTGFNPEDLLGQNSNNPEAKVYSELPKANASLKTLLPNRVMISSLELRSLVPQVGKNLLDALPKDFKDSLPFQTFSGTISNQELDLILSVKNDPKLAQELSNFNQIISDIEKTTGLTRAQIAERLDASVDELALRRMLEITNLYGSDNRLQVSDLQRAKGVEVGSVVIVGARTVLDARNNTAIQSGLLGYGLFINPESKALFNDTLGVREDGIPMVFRKAIGTVRDTTITGKGIGIIDKFDSGSYSKMVSVWKDFKAGKLDDIQLTDTSLSQIRSLYATKGVNLSNEQIEEIVFMKYYLDSIENGRNWAWGRLGVGDFKPGKDLLTEYQTNFAKFNKVDASQNINSNTRSTSADLAINQEGLNDIMKNPLKAAGALVSLLTGSGTIGVQITNEQNIDNGFTGSRANAARYDEASQTVTIDRNKLGGDAPTAVQLLQIAKGLGLDSSIPFAIMSGSSTESSSSSAQVGSIKVEIVGQPSKAEQAVTGSIIQNLRDNAKAIYRDDMDPKVALYKAVAANLDQLKAQGKLTDAEYKISIELAQKSSEFVLTYKEKIRLTNGGSLGELGVLAQTQGYTVTGYTVPIKDAVRTTIGIPISEVQKLEGGDIYNVSQKMFNASAKTMGMSETDAANMAKQLIDLRRNAVAAGRVSTANELQTIRVPEGYEILTKKMSVAAKSGIITESTLPNGRKVYVFGTVHTGLNGQGQIDGRIVDQSEDPDVITIRDKKTGREILIARNSPNCPQADWSIEYDTASISVDCRQTGNCTPLELDMLRGRLTANQDTLNSVVVMNQATLNTDRAFTGGAQELVKAISIAEKTNLAIAKPLSDALRNPTPEALTRFQQETGVVIDPAIAQSLSKQGMILDAQATMVSIRQQYKEKFGIDIGPMMIGFNWGDSGKIDAEAEVSLRITGLTAETERDASGALRYKLDSNGQPIPCFNVEVFSKGKSSKEWENKGSVIFQIPVPKPPKPPEPPKREPPKVPKGTKPVDPNAPVSTPPPGPGNNPFAPRPPGPNAPIDPSAPVFQPPGVVPTNPLPPTTIPNVPTDPTLTAPVFTAPPITNVPTPIPTTIPVTPINPTITTPVFTAPPVISVPTTIPTVTAPTPFLPTFNAPTSTGVTFGS